MGKRNGIGITKIMFGASSILLVIVIVGFLVSPIAAKNMKNNIYAFSDTSESIIFEQMLNENKIPCKKISSNVFSIEPEWENEADNIYKTYFEENGN